MVEEIIFNILFCLLKQINAIYKCDFISLLYNFGEYNYASLISYEITLITLYFTILPIIINTQNEVYLGHNISKWIFYDKDKNKSNPIKDFIKSIINVNLSSVAYDWIINIFLVFLCLILSLFNQYVIIVILFIIFFIRFSIKIIDYFNSLSVDFYKNGIECNFLELCKSNKDELCNMLVKNKAFDLETRRETLSFILKNYDVTNMNIVYQQYYKVLQGEGSIEIIYMLFSEIAKEIDRRKSNHLSRIDLQINSLDLKYFVVNCIKESNSKDARGIIGSIIYNEIMLTLEDESNYEDFLSVMYSGVLKNSSITEDTRNNMLSDILYFTNYIISYKDKELSYIKFKYIFNLFKYVIYIRSKYGLEYMYNNLNHNVKYVKQNYYFILYILIIYLYYLINIETVEYVDEKEKEYLRTVKDKILNIITKNSINHYIINVDILFDWVDKISSNWERFNYGNGNILDVKSPKCDYAILIAKRLFYIKYRKNISFVNQSDLEIFRDTIEDNKLKENCLSEINDFSEFIGISISDYDIKNYISILLEFARKNYEENHINSKGIDYYKHEMNSLINSKFKKLKKLELFNSDNVEKTIKVEHDISRHNCSKSLLDSYINEGDLFTLPELEEILEDDVISHFTNLRRVNYFYDTENIILNKLKRVNKKYVYIRPINDDLDEDYKFGKEYLNVLSKFKIVNTNISFDRVLIDKYKCCLKKAYFVVEELTSSDLNKMIEYYKDEDGYCYIDDYDYKIRCNRARIINYCKDNFIKCKLVFEIGIDTSNSSGYKFIWC